MSGFKIEKRDVAPTLNMIVTDGVKNDLIKFSNPPNGAIPTPPKSSITKFIYIVRHAEAEHNVVEREAIKEAQAMGIDKKSQLDLFRQNVLREGGDAFLDAPLSKEGVKQASATGMRMNLLLKPNETQLERSHYRPPQVVLVSPLRRALQTATRCFLGDTEIDINAKQPRFVAMEALREKRTGLFCDERRSVSDLQKEFPHVDFSDLKRQDLQVIHEGETNEAVRQRATEFLNNIIPHVEGEFLALVSHKGWLREMRQALKNREENDPSRLTLKFDIDDWHQTLFENAELRVAKFEWDLEGHLHSIVSRSLDHTIEREAGVPTNGVQLGVMSSTLASTNKRLKTT